MGTASSAYVLHIFNTRDFEGVIEKKRYYALHGLVLLLFTTYAVLFRKLHRFLKSYDKYPVNTGVVFHKSDILESLTYGQSGKPSSA